MRPATVSKGGLSGADGWLLVGRNILVLAKLLAMESLSPGGSDFSRRGRSSDSSSSMCLFNVAQSLCRVGLKSGSEAEMFWNS